MEKTLEQFSAQRQQAAFFKPGREAPGSGRPVNPGGQHEVSQGRKNVLTFFWKDVFLPDYSRARAGSGVLLL